jgi:hypothetical protein
MRRIGEELRQAKAAIRWRLGVWVAGWSTLLLDGEGVFEFFIRASRLLILRFCSSRSRCLIRPRRDSTSSNFRFTAARNSLTSFLLAMGR